MIYGYLHQGSGVGNQLHRYIATRIKALELNTDWRLIWNPDNSGKVDKFKCKEFMKFDESKIQYEMPNTTEWLEKKVVDQNGVDIRSYDPEWNFIKDGTLIEGEFQDEKYWENYEEEVNNWLKVEPISMKDDVCVIGFRGGEFTVFPDLFLTKEYWEEAIKMMREINPNMKFEVHTDDPVTAQQFFPNFKVIQNVGINWRSMRYAKYAIIANSSFYILPRWLNKGVTIAPRYWARRNTKVWALPQNYYKRFTYI
jgi:hypothetical protein